MIFRRLAQHLREQNWTAIAIEFVLLVLGVFLGIQVANWNEQRLAHEQGDVWRRQILADLDMNAHDLQSRIDYNRQALAFGEGALAALEAEQMPDGDAIWDAVLGAFQAGQIRPYRLTGPTFREVQNAGGLALIGSEETQGALAYLYDVSAHDFELVSGGLPRYRQLIRERLSWSIQNHIWDSECERSFHLPGRPGNDEEFELLRCAPPPDTALLQRALEQLRADPELLGALRGRLSQLKVSIASTGRLIERVRAVRERVQ